MLFEIRSYRFQPGRAADYAAAFEQHRGSIPTFTKNLVGMWSAESGVLNRLLHLWRYEDAEDRAAGRGLNAASPAWPTFAAQVMPALLSQESTLYTGTISSTPPQAAPGLFDLVNLTFGATVACADVDAHRTAVHSHLAGRFEVCASLVATHAAPPEAVFLVRSESDSDRTAHWSAVDLGGFLAGALTHDVGADLHMTSDLLSPVAFSPMR